MLQYITPSGSTTPLMKESILGTGKTHGSDLAVMKEELDRMLSLVGWLLKFAMRKGFLHQHTLHKHLRYPSPM